jgi:HK97 gp10 family phage protein
VAKCEVKLPDEVYEKLAKLGDKTDKITREILEAGAKPVLATVKSNLRSVIGRAIKTKSRSTGELLNSVGISPVSIDKQGISNIKIGFAEPRKQQYKPKNWHYSKRTKGLVADRGYYTSTNALIAGVLEYGRHGQPAKPFMKPAKNSSKGACVKAMEEKFNEEVSKL